MLQLMADIQFRRGNYEKALEHYRNILAQKSGQRLGMMFSQNGFMTSPYMQASIQWNVIHMHVYMYLYGICI